ncbi:MAG: BrnA antitoxin family protein [Candidatus Saccharimonadales bacterium]
MSNTTNYTNAPTEIDQSMEDATIVSDFLPSPAELTRKVEKEKITIAIDKQSLDSFRRYAKTHNTKYQTMINGVLGSYADKFLE